MSSVTGMISKIAVRPRYPVLRHATQPTGARTVGRVEQRVAGVEIAQQLRGVVSGHRARAARRRACRTSRCATTHVSDDATRYGSMPMSTSRIGAADATRRVQASTAPGDR